MEIETFIDPSINNCILKAINDPHSKQGLLILHNTTEGKKRPYITNQRS